LIDRENGVVHVNRHMTNVECPPFYSRVTGLDGLIDRNQDIEYFAPGFYVLHARIAPAGLPEGAEGAFHVKILYGLTPSTASRTYDFWAVCRDFALDDDDVSSFMDKMQWEIVQQDVDALNILEQRTAKDPNLFEVGVRIDRGAVAARHLNRQLATASTESDELPRRLANVGGAKIDGEL